MQLQKKLGLQIEVICQFKFKETGPNEIIWNVNELTQEAAMEIVNPPLGCAVASLMPYSSCPVELS